MCLETNTANANHSQTLTLTIVRPKQPLVTPHQVADYQPFEKMVDGHCVGDGLELTLNLPTSQSESVNQRLYVAL